jgi:hypothetical protein
MIERFQIKTPKYTSSLYTVLTSRAEQRRIDDLTKGLSALLIGRYFSENGAIKMEVEDAVGIRSLEVSVYPSPYSMDTTVIKHGYATNSLDAVRYVYEGEDAPLMANYSSEQDLSNTMNFRELRRALTMAQGLQAIEPLSAHPTAV